MASGSSMLKVSESDAKRSLSQRKAKSVLKRFHDNVFVLRSHVILVRVRVRVF